jgi:methyl-accepting chemotaxis protein
LRVARDDVTGSRIDQILGLSERSPNIVGSLRTAISGVYKVGEEWLDMYVAPITSPTGQLVALFMAGTIVIARQQMAQAIASASEQMMAAISEIARNPQRAARTANEAARAAETANETVTKLGQSSAQVGGIVELISRIASQTRLLALNATIEAARVGEAGRGFAVVANEVKQLAQETAQATEEIGARVEAIQEQS